jgi:hypothetical protein
VHGTASLRVTRPLFINVIRKVLYARSAARVIATGTVIGYNEDIQLNLRLTDTETTVLKAAITESAKDIDMLAQNVVKIDT